MKIPYTVVPVILAVSLAAGTVQADMPRVTTTAADRTSLEVTVYTQDVALVRDARRVMLPTGRGELLFSDVASTVLPHTLQVSCSGDRRALNILEQSYSYDLINEKTLLDRYLGKTVKIIDYNRHHDRKDVVEAVLLGNRDDRIFKIGNEIYLGHPGIIVLPDAPDTVATQPALTCLFEHKGAGHTDITASYLAEGIAWRADYVLSVQEKKGEADLASWASISNQSGADLHDTRFSLVAGEISRIRNDRMDALAEGMLMARTADAADQFEEAPLFEYHRYDLQRSTSIAHNQTKQISFLAASGVPVEREYEVIGRQARPRAPAASGSVRVPVHVSLSFGNTEAANLGVPLPAGVVRLFTQDERGRSWFVGENRIDHTPKNGTVRLLAGEAFDVTAERRQAAFQQITSRVFESRWEIVLKNEKAEAVVVRCLEQLAGNWTIIDSSHEYEVVDAFRIRFDVLVPPGETRTLDYRVRTET